MQLLVDGTEIFAGTGGRAFDPGLPTIVFLHGAGLDHTVWALLARWFAHRGFGVLAPDLPGHGRSESESLQSIAAMADFTAARMTAFRPGASPPPVQMPMQRISVMAGGRLRDRNTRAGEVGVL